MKPHPPARAVRPTDPHSWLGIAGEVSLTLGAIGLLFFAWYLGVNDWIQGSLQARSASAVSAEWGQGSDPTFGKDRGESDGTATALDPPVVADVAEGNAFAVLYVPRFGSDYARTIAEGVDLPTVLNSRELGVGRYPQTAQFGELGNVGIAGHRTTYGASFSEIGELRVGDRLYVEVEQGWFSYQFRNLEYVWPTQVEVLAPVPHQPDAEATERLLTLTSCHPRLSEAERIIAYAVFEAWYPRAEGPPAEIAPIATEVT
ncbi:MAG: class E sortase [Pontimonas sp.]